MPEGHVIHSAARKHRRILVGHLICVSSPQGRFHGEALKLSGNKCQAVEAYGKHLVYIFDNNNLLHIHLGLFGRIRLHKSTVVQPSDTVRVRLEGNRYSIDIIGPSICETFTHSELERLKAKIGPDPLRDDSDSIRVFNRISNSRTAIGKLIMDQSVIAGIGNIYRTEILWRQNIHPNTVGRLLTQSQLESIWNDAKFLLNIGVKKNSIVTTDDQISGSKKSKETLNIFGKISCPRCDANIVQLEINGRRAFVCERCQPQN